MTDKSSKNHRKTVALGLSGGVDSAVAAKLLLDQGYDVVGVYLQCYQETGCRADTDRLDALRVALHLGIKFISLDFRNLYQKNVLDYFYQAYAQGLTPNPDLLCNLEVKFGPFYDWARTHHFDFIATGHYARLIDNQLATPTDQNKDQTYFLALVPQERWSHVLFPLSDLTKPQVRQLARDFALPVQDKSDSTGVCFVGELPLRDFLSQKIPPTPGPVVYQNPQTHLLETIGTHHGAAYYTLGQRHGFTITISSPNTPPLYVVAKDLITNTLRVGEKAACFSTTFIIQPTPDLLSIFAPYLENPYLPLFVRLRHQAPLLPVTISSSTPSSNPTSQAATISESIPSKLRPDSPLQFTLASPVFALAPGQFAVFYNPTSRAQANSSSSSLTTTPPSNSFTVLAAAPLL